MLHTVRPSAVTSSGPQNVNFIASDMPKVWRSTTQFDAPRLIPRPAKESPESTDKPDSQSKRCPAPTRQRHSSTPSTAPCRRSRTAGSRATGTSRSWSARVSSQHQHQLAFSSTCPTRPDVLTVRENNKHSPAPAPGRGLPEAPPPGRRLAVQPCECALAEGCQLEGGDFAQVGSTLPPPPTRILSFPLDPK